MNLAHSKPKSLNQLRIQVEASFSVGSLVRGTTKAGLNVGVNVHYATD